MSKIEWETRIHEEDAVGKFTREPVSTYGKFLWIEPTDRAFNVPDMARTEYYRHIVGAVLPITPKDIKKRMFFRKT